MKLELKTKNGVLILDGGNPDWSSINLEYKGRSIHIGKDALHVIAAKLSEGLHPNHGDFYSYILGLMDPHGNIYAKKHNDGLALMFQDKDAQELGVLNITENERSDWLNQLTKLQAAALR